MPNGSDHDQGRRDRRRYKRTHVLFSGRLFSGKRAVEGLILDLSASGARVQFAEPIVTNSAMTLRLANSVDIAVEVAWHKDNCLGVQFCEVPGRISSIFAGLLPEDCLAVA
jgi:hypothetical protein